MDGNWTGYGPLSPGMDYSISWPDLKEIERNAIRAIDFMKESVEGKFVIGLHTSPYCRNLFYQEPLLSIWKNLVMQGGELAIHPHEEIYKSGTLVHEKNHMQFVIHSKFEQLGRVGLTPTSFRTGYNAYDNSITNILEELGINVDLSCVPGLENPLWRAFWKTAPFSAYKFCSIDYSHVKCEHPPSNVLEIPRGCDGLPTNTSPNTLFNERKSLNQLEGIWNTIEKRSRSEPQFVHFLCHLHAMNDQELSDRCKAFLDYAQKKSATIVTPSIAWDYFEMDNKNRS
jgi:hypothetical protein